MPYKYLNLPLTDIAEALLNNIKQLMELYKSEEEKSSSAFFFQSYVGLENVPNLLRNLQQLYDEQEHLELVIAYYGSTSLYLIFYFLFID